MILPHLLGGPVVALFGWLLRASLSATVIAGLIVAMQVLLGRWLTPAWRYRLWGVMVVRLLLPAIPVLPATLLNFDRHWNQSGAVRQNSGAGALPVPMAFDIPPQAPGASGSHVVVVYGAIPAAATTRELKSPDKTPALISSWAQYESILIALWLAVAAFLLVRLAASNMRLARLLRRAEPLTDPALGQLLIACCKEMGIARAPAMLLTDAVRAPAVWGVWNPRILIPADLPADLSPPQRRAILLHELAHIRCADLAVNWVLAFLGILHWFNPLLRPALARVRADREAARDAMVLAIMSRGDAPAAADTYARTMLKLAESLCVRSGGSLQTAATGYGLLPGFFTARSDLRKRLDLVRQFPACSQRLRAAGPIFAVALAACAMATACKPVANPSGSVPTSSSAQSSVSPHATSEPTEASVPQMVARVHSLVDARQYPSALSLAEQILARDPQNNYASLIRPWLRDQVAFEDGVDADVPSDLALQRKLDHVYPQLQFSGMGLSDVIEFFRGTAGLNIFVNWKSLESAGVHRDAPVNLRVAQVTLSQGLRLALASAAGRDGLLGFAVDEGVITVSSTEDLSKNVSVRVYDVRDLLTVIPDFAAVRLGATVPTTMPAVGVEKHAPAATREELVKMLTEAIESTIDPGSWKDNGGSAGTIRELNGQLILTQTPANQRRVLDMLRKIRESRQLQITVEARFFRCSHATAETLLAGWQKAGGHADLGTAGASRPGGAGAAPLALYLNPDQVTEFLKHVEDSPDLSMQNAPRITLFNGQRAWIEIGTPEKYVSGYTAVVAAGGQTRFDPIKSASDTGLMFEVQATVSADRKYATLWLHPQLSTLLGMKQAPWPGSPAGLNLMIQEPQVSSFELQTTVSIPDGGTILLSGLQMPPATNASSVASQPGRSPQSILMLIKSTVIAMREVDQRPYPLRTSKIKESRP